MIYIPSGRFIEAQDASLSLVEIEGWMTLESVARSGRVSRSLSFKEKPRKAGPFHNMLLDAGMDGFGDTATVQLYRNAEVGTGTTPPAVTDTQLSNYLGFISGVPVTTRGNSGAPDYEYSWIRIQHTSGIGQFGEVNLTELGVTGSGQQFLFSRELIRDATGEPVAFPLMDDEQFRFTYELRLYRPLADAFSQVQIGSQTHDTITRALNVSSSSWGLLDIGNNVNSHAIGGCTAHTGALAAVTASSPGGSNIGNTNDFSDKPYQTGDYYLDSSFRFGPNQGSGSVRTLSHGRRCARFQTEYDPPIDKTSSQTLILPQRFSWARR